jgi:hypothetical protein
MAKSKPFTTPAPSTQASKNQALVRIDMNHAVFQAQLFELEKPIRHAAIDTLKKLRQMTWAQVYQDPGLKWEKIRNQLPAASNNGQVHYSLRITQARRAVAWRDGEYLRFLDKPPDHDATCGKK